MIVIGIVFTLAIFVFVGWAVSSEMFQQRQWRRRAAEGDPDIIGALISDSLNRWRRSRPPKTMPPNRWSAIQQAEVVAVAPDIATLSTSLVLEYQTVAGRRVPTTYPIAEAQEVAAALLDLILFDVPNLRLGSVRVDVYAGFAAEDGGTTQRPILSSTASRAVADAIFSDELNAVEVLRRFDTLYHPSEGYELHAIELPPVEGERPRPAAIAAQDAPWNLDRESDGNG
ncbi:MAG: hypothetical protein KC470_09395 [Dehalococcoidia bacterium]|nr:hypothetical protein [Dehalococcoidia bacterium]